MEVKRSQFACKDIDYLNLDRERRPTERDCELLEKNEENVFQLYLCCNSPPLSEIEVQIAVINGKKKPRKRPPKTKKIINFLWEKFRLYKLRSESPYSLKRSMYVGVMKDGDQAAIEKTITNLIDELKTDLENEEEFNVEEARVTLVPPSKEEIKEASFEEDEDEEEEMSWRRKKKRMKHNEDEYTSSSEEERGRKGRRRKERWRNKLRKRGVDEKCEKEREEMNKENESDSDILKRMKVLEKEYNSDSSDSVHCD